MGKDQNDIFGGGGGGLDGAATSGSSSSSGSSSDESVEIRKHHPVTNQPRPMMPMPMATAAKHGRLFDNLVVLDNLPEAEVGGGGGTTVAVGSVMGGDVDDDCDELFLLPESVLAMDSASFREDVRSVAPSLLNTAVIAASSSSPHNSLDSTDSARSLRGAAAAASACAEESSDGLLRMARASEGCKTLWLCEFYYSRSLLSR